LAIALSSERLPPDLIREWFPVRVKKTRQTQNQNLKFGFDFHRNRTGPNY
jgi:hypothetical protein